MSVRSVRFSSAEFAKLKELLLIYEWGHRTLLTKLTILHEDFENFRDDNPIDHIRGRIKAPESIAEKLQRLGHEITVENARKFISDIAGVRIICPFVRDIYHLVDLLKQMPDITICEEKNYMEQPKPSGYRSYHLAIEVPVFYAGKIETVAIEVQIRTEAMNFWATLEHEAQYKYQGDIPEHLSAELVVCADEIAALDQRMFLIHQNILGHSTAIIAELTDDRQSKEKNKPLRGRELRRSYRGIRRG